MNADPIDPIGTRIGAYRVESRLGRGGMGEVFMAWDERLQRHVAIKRIRRDKELDEERPRFRREAQAVAQLRHPAIVQVHDIVAGNGGDHIVMEYVEGESLDRLIARGEPNLGLALRLAREIAEGLAEAHGKGLVHRDLKSANVLIAHDDTGYRARILDFGLVRWLDGGAPNGDEHLTASGAVLGTAYTMSPEQAGGGEADARSDLFALGVLLYELLAGRPPFSGKNVLDTLRRIRRQRPVPLVELRPELPAALDRLIARLLEKDPSRRPSSAARVARELRELELATVPAAAASHPGAVTSEIHPPATTAEPEAVLRVLVRVEGVDPGRWIESLGEPRGVEVAACHERGARDLLGRFEGLETARGETLFEHPAHAVAYALAYHQECADLARAQGVQLEPRTGIHFGEVFLRHNPSQDVERGAPPVEVAGAAKSLVTRIAALAEARQILLTRAAFDLTRSSSSAHGLTEPALRWSAHGEYVFEGLAGEPVEIFEVGREGFAPLTAPASSTVGRRVVSAAAEAVLGWRPAIGQAIPGRPNWVLAERVGEGGFGEVWRAGNQLREERIFKFCFEAERLRALKREVTLFRLLKEALGHRHDIARLLDWNLDTAPFFLEVEYTPAGSLADWADRQGGLAKLPLATRLELVAQVADALAAAHSVGILHKDVKPANVLIAEDRRGRPEIRLTDFGIGMLTDRRQLAARGVTALGFTATETPTTSSAGGTLAYMAPELIGGRTATIQADVYSLGVLLYQMAVGDFSRTPVPGWREDVGDELLREDIADAVHGLLKRRLRDAARLAERLRTLDARRAERARARRTRRLQRLAVAALVAGAVALAFGAVALGLWRTSERNRHLAQQRELEARDLARASLANSLLADGRSSLGNLVLLDVRRPAETAGAAGALAEALSRAVETATLTHDESLRHVEWSPDASRVVTASADETARVWDGVTGEELTRFEGHAGAVTWASWNPAGTRILTASEDGTARVWDAATSTELIRFDTHTAAVTCAVWSPDGTRVASGSRDKTARVWEPATGAELAVLRGHKEQVTAVFWSPDGTRLLSTSGYFTTTSPDTAVRVWDASTGAELVVLRGHGKPIRDASWSPDGVRILTAADDATARVWDGNTGAELLVLEGHTDRLYGATWSADGSRILTSSSDTTARVWDAATGAEIEILADHGDRVYSASWSSDGSRILTGSRDKTARLWHVATGTELAVLSGNEESVSVVSWSPDDSRTVVTAGTRAKIWDAAASGYELKRLLGHTDRLLDVFWNTDGSRLVTFSSDTTVRIWDAVTGTEVLNLGNGGFGAPSWSPATSRVVTVDRHDHTTRFWDAVTGREIGAPVGSEDFIRSHRWSPDGARLATVYETVRPVLISDPVTGGQVALLEGHTDPVRWAAWSPDSSRLATVSWDGTGRIWDAATGAEIAVLDGHTKTPRDIAWNPDGRRVATGSEDKTARVWDAATGEALAVLEGHTGQVSQVHWSPDGSTLLTISKAFKLRIWDVSTGALLGLLSGHTGRVTSAFWSSDGTRILTSSWDGTARTWDASTGKKIAIVAKHPDPLWWAEWNPDETLVATASWDQTARIWVDFGDRLEYLQARIRGRNRLCLDQAFYENELGESADAARRLTAACERCVPAFYDALDDAPKSDVPAWIAAWETYRQCLDAAALATAA